MQFVINFNMDNASFDGKEQEISRILNKVSERVKKGELEGNIIDHNGNTVGEFYENLCEIE